MDPFTAFLLFTALLTIETLASHFYIPAYFVFGIPVYLSSGSLNKQQDMIGWASILNQLFRGNPVHPSIVFKKIRKNTKVLNGEINA